MLSIRGTDFIAYWAYEEQISAHAQPAVKWAHFYMYNPCWAYAERILSHTEHTGNEFHRMQSILGTDFIACWACAEMFKSRISRPNRIWFSKISCYRPLGPLGFGFCKKRQKKKSCLCTFNLSETPWPSRHPIVRYTVECKCTSCIQVRISEHQKLIKKFRRCWGFGSAE